MIVILDLGSTENTVLARQIREIGVYSEIHPHDITVEELKALGFEFGDSKSNFIFATHPDVDIVKLFEDLKQADIYVRHFNKPERVVPYLRISIGTDEEMRELIDFLKNYIRKGC